MKDKTRIIVSTVRSNENRTPRSIAATMGKDEIARAAEAASNTPTIKQGGWLANHLEAQKPKLPAKQSVTGASIIPTPYVSVSKPELKPTSQREKEANDPFIAVGNRNDPMTKLVSSREKLLEEEPMDPGTRMQAKPKPMGRL